MKKINATRDQIIEMLKSGEIVFAADCEDGFLRGQGIIMYDNKPAYARRSREREADLINYGGCSTSWFVDYGKPFEFKVGDICEFGGVEGVIGEVRDVAGFRYPVIWKSICGNGTCFTLDGRQYKWHTKPLLNFIRRPKKKVKKTIEIVTWVEVDSGGSVVRAHHAMPPIMNNKNKLLKSIATTEIEVEE